MTDLKLASHIHSAFSDDSDWELERLVRVLSRAGFDGALVCDHDRTMDESIWAEVQRQCDAIGERTGFLLVPGVEYQDPDHVVHLPVFGRVSFYGRSPDVGEVIRQSRRDGGASVFAHPARREAWRRFDPAWAADLSAIEVWNRKYDGIRPNSWALRVSGETGLAPTVSLDWHGPRQLYPLAIRTPDPGSGSNRERSDRVVECMRAGSTRATAFGRNVTDFEQGALGSAFRGLESLRRWSAPRIRRVERAVRGHR